MSRARCSVRRPGLHVRVCSRCPRFATTDLIISSQPELELDRLLQSLETPVAFLFFQRRNPKELLDRLLGCLSLHLLCVVVFVLHVDISTLLGIIVVLVLEVVAMLGQSRAQQLLQAQIILLVI